ncbi:MAG: membrane dipeptidase [Alphaproteobacteria bacterium]|nr:membrane dipeptidase [Alphaproteobacteria bacterium]
MPLDYVDHRADPAAWAAALGAPVAACELLLDAHFIDLHCDLEVPVRLFGYDPVKRHGPWRRVMPFFFQTDYPRLREASFTGVCYDLATNVFRGERSRFDVTVANVARCIRQVEAHPDELGIARTRADYDRIVADGRTAMWLTLQGGNAVSHDPTVLDGPLGRDLHRITLVHLSSSVFGGSNSPSQPDRGLTDRGRAMVAICNRNRILVDLAHAGRRTFWDALEVHDPGLPPIVSHTGVCGVRELWRNIDDAQIRAIADRGGVVGIVYQGSFLEPVPSGFASRRAAILDHMEHVIAVGGEEACAIGTDYDGLITPPKDLVDVTHHPLLVGDMLARGWSEARIRRVLGENYLRVVAAVRPE